MYEGPNEKITNNYKTVHNFMAKWHLFSVPLLEHKAKFLVLSDL